MKILPVQPLDVKPGRYRAGLDERMQLLSEHPGWVREAQERIVDREADWFDRHPRARVHIRRSYDDEIEIEHYLAQRFGYPSLARTWTMVVSIPGGWHERYHFDADPPFDPEQVLPGLKHVLAAHTDDEAYSLLVQAIAAAPGRRDQR
jgi:hypothetical protein